LVNGRVVGCWCVGVLVCWLVASLLVGGSVGVFHGDPK